MFLVAGPAGHRDPGHPDHRRRPHQHRAYSDVRVDDKYLLGEPNGGWTVLRGPLDAEHGKRRGEQRRSAGPGDHGASGRLHGRCRRYRRRRRRYPGADGTRPVDGGAVAYRLGRSIAKMEACLSTPSIFGRVAQAQIMRDIAPDVMDILGTAALLPVETDGAVDAGKSEYVYRFAPLAGIYGGSLEVPAT